MLYRPNILFDFDGTLFDTAPGILHCMRDALTACGYDPGDDAALRRFVGPPVLEALHTFYGMSDAEARDAISEYRSAYRAQGVYECTPMPGAEDCLRALRAAGARIGIAHLQTHLLRGGDTCAASALTAISTPSAARRTTRTRARRRSSPAPFRG